MIISIPSVIVLSGLLLSLYGGSIRFTTPMLFALAFLPMFGIGGLTGLPLGLAPSDIHLHDTYYVIGHFHYVVAPGTIFALFDPSGFNVLPIIATLGLMNVIRGGTYLLSGGAWVSAYQMSDGFKAIARMVAGPSAEQGLLIARDHYDRLGGYRPEARRSEATLVVEPGRPSGEFVTARGGVGTVELKASGHQ